MEKEVFDKEIAMCRKLSQKNNGKCAWGECDKCGVVLLLYKLGMGEFYDAPADIEKIKHNVLK